MANPKLNREGGTATLISPSHYAHYAAPQNDNAADNQCGRPTSGGGRNPLMPDLHAASALQTSVPRQTQHRGKQFHRQVCSTSHSTINKLSMY